MAHLISRGTVQTKLAALRSADVLGRRMAQDRAVEQMAKVAGVIFAQIDELPEMEKVAWQMVERGQLSPEQFQFLKEAGIFGRIGKWMAGKAPKAGRSIRSGTSTVLGKLKAPGLAQRVAPIRRTAGGRVSGRGGVEARRAAQRQVPAAKKSRTVGREMQQQVAAGPQVPKGQPIQMGKTQPTTTPTGAQRGGRQTGKVREAPAGQQPTTSTAKSKEMAAEAAQQQATKQQPSEQQGGSWWDRLRGRGGAAAPAKKGGGWGRLALYGGAGLGAYGLYRGAGWGARQLEQASTTPWAHGGGWSPVPYGYGHSPYGPGSPTMGAGA